MLTWHMCACVPRNLRLNSSRGTAGAPRALYVSPHLTSKPAPGAQALEPVACEDTGLLGGSQAQALLRGLEMKATR